MRVELADFDAEFFNILEDHDKILFDKKGVYHTIFVDGEKAGVVGFIPVVSDDKAGFVQIVLSENYRGKGVLAEAEDLVARVHGLKILYATSEEKNVASIKAHIKAGFRVLEKEKIEMLKQKGFLKENQIRLVKSY